MEATATPINPLSILTTATGLPPAMNSAIRSMDEAAYEALGILEVMHEGGNIQPLYRDLCATVIEKYRQARRDMNRERT